MAAACPAPIRGQRSNRLGREEAWPGLVSAIDAYFDSLDQDPVLPTKPGSAFLNRFSFQQAFTPVELLQSIATALTEHQVHTPQRRYFGVSHPSPSGVGIAADALASALNPQLAAYAHSPLAAGIEIHLIRSFGEHFGFSGRAVDGMFTPESSLTTLLVALYSRWKLALTEGIRAIPNQPVLYLSDQGHPGFAGAARAAGLGSSSLRLVPSDSGFRMNIAALDRMLYEDKKAGHVPFLVIATAGTAGTGAIDPIKGIASLAARHQLWLHVDAAWGGAAALVSELRPFLSGIEYADSITFDPHRWLSLPSTLGMFLTRHPMPPRNLFRIPTSHLDGLKLFLALAVAGWNGFEGIVRHQVGMGDRLRIRLRDAGWKLLNDTPLPVVCFAGAKVSSQAIADAVVAAGDAWVSTVRLGEQTALRACITNSETSAIDVEALIRSLDQARKGV